MLWIPTLWTKQVTSVRKCDFLFVVVKDTSSMFLLHRRLGGVDGFTDAAQL